MPWSIRPATLQEAATIIDFNCKLAEESEGKILEPNLIEAGVKTGLSDKGKALYFIAMEKEGKIVGQTMVTFEWSDWRNGWIWWIQSVYVVPEARRQGVFKALFEHIRQEAKARPDVIGLRLYVEDNNVRAHETYLNLGMKKAGYFVLEKFPI